MPLLLHVKGIKSIVDNEGMIYTILHKEELLGTLESYWSKTGEKYYKLTNKGLKIVQIIRLGTKKAALET